jgi:hypothetical protein
MVSYATILLSVTFICIRKGRYLGMAGKNGRKTKKIQKNRFHIEDFNGEKPWRKNDGLKRGIGIGAMDIFTS